MGFRTRGCVGIRSRTLSCRSSKSVYMLCLFSLHPTRYEGWRSLPHFVPQVAQSRVERSHNNKRTHMDREKAVHAWSGSKQRRWTGCRWNARGQLSFVFMAEAGTAIPTRGHLQSHRTRREPEFSQVKTKHQIRKNLLDLTLKVSAKADINSVFEKSR